MSTVLLERYDAYLSKLYKKLRTEDYGPYTCVHFGRTEKVGIYTKPSHHDPIGVYAFPKDYVLNNIKNTGFANMAYSHILTATPKAKVLNLNMTMNRASSLLSLMGIPTTYLVDASTYHNSGASAGHLFWGSMERWRNENNLSKNASWNGLFKKTGYNVLYDPGEKIIHWAEPSQLVFLEPGTYKVIETFRKETNSDIWRSFIKEFPNWIPKKTKTYGETVLRLTHPENKTQLEIFKGKDNFEFNVNVYGRADKNTKERLDKKMLRYREDASIEGALKDVRDYLAETIPHIDDFYRNTNKSVSNLKEFSQHFKLRLDSSKIYGSNRIYKLYKELHGEANIKLIVFFSGDIININISRYQQWSSYNYNFRYEGEYTSPRDTMETAFRHFDKEIEKLANKDDFDSRYQAERAAVAMKFLKRNVFKL